MVPNEQNEHVLPEGTTLAGGRYEIRAVLGEGGFGITYLAFDKTLRVQVAVKEYFPADSARRDVGETLELLTVQGSLAKGFDQGKERFLREARVLARFIGKPGVVDVLNFFQENRTAYMVMEYLEGITLAETLKQEGPIPPDRLFAMAGPLMETLDKIHQQGVIHRDISPDNLMLTPDGRLTLLDFGASRDFSPLDDKSMTVLLKHGYAPVEQYSGREKQGPWTDVYALCATLYACLTGKTPDYSVDRALRDKLVWPSQLGVEISQGQEEALRRGMALKAADRYQTVEELRQALLPPAQEEPKPGRRRGKPWMLGAVGGILLAAALVFALWGRGLEYDPETMYMVTLTAHWDSSVRDFEEDLELLRERVELFSNGSAYSLEVEGDTVELLLPRDSFAGKDIENVLTRYLVRSTKFYAWDGESHSLVLQEPLIAREDMEELSLETGVIPGVDPVENELPEAGCDYLKMTLTEEAARRVEEASAQWNGLAFAYDVTESQPIHYFQTFPAGDGRTYYLYGRAEDENLARLEYHNLTQDSLNHSFDYIVRYNVLWETGENGDLGANQVPWETLSGETVTVCCDMGQEYTEGERVDTLAELKSRLDCLELPYAFGVLRDDPNTLAFCMSPERLNENVIEIVTTGAVDLRLIGGLSQADVSSYSTTVETVETEAGWGLRLELPGGDIYKDADNLAYLTGWLAERGGGPVHLVSGDLVPLMSTYVTEEVRDGVILLDQVSLEGVDDPSWLVRLLETVLSDEGVPVYLVVADYQFSSDWASGDEELFGVGRPDELPGLEDIRPAVLEVWPDAKMSLTGGTELTVLLDLPVDETLPERGPALAKEIYEAVGFQESMLQNLGIVFIREDEERGERARVFFYKSYGFGEEGGPYANGMFYGGRLEACKDSFREAVQSDPFYVEMHQRSFYGWHFAP